MIDMLAGSVLFFNMYDPSHRAHLPAEVVTASLLGTHSSSVTTALAVQDSTQLESLEPIEASIIEAQARCILEDLPVNAFKINHLLTIEMIEEVASILADYNQIPTVLVLSKYLSDFISRRGDFVPNEKLHEVYLDFLAPHTNVVILDLNYLSTWLSEEYQINTGADLLALLIELGVESCFILNEKMDNNTIQHTIYHSSGERDQFVQPLHISTPAEFADMIGTAVSCFLAQEVPLFEACRMAISFTNKQLEHLIQIGMGRPFPNRLAFYEIALSVDDEDDDDDEYDIEDDEDENNNAYRA
ncbi:hypothetical protein V757_05900 [Pelistega indica]|uniref:Pyridoxamine kinase/Phosphomethylpyrimidine kinase domain-containing protein n=1 Tax=Pelistega indica TaxID=1414851 RepID=V8G7U7_9BURK|nr:MULTISPECIES: bifunctional hydroxymethylpyrimidine kinase/phosphomethylpyrimidine kinase [Pelistega]ETD72181.1 hypothetical protein V757_05900 [Pelistega indica]